MTKARRILFITVLCLIAGAFHVSCDGGGDSSGQNTQKTTINGTVTNDLPPIFIPRQMRVSP
jgi:hypothetical protein